MKVSISQAWDETRAVLTRDGKLISTVALALLVLPGLVMNVLFPHGGSVPAPAQQAIWAALGIVILLVSFTGQLSVVRLAMGPHISVGEAIHHAASRLLPFFGAFLIWVVPLFLLGLLPYALIRTNPSTQTIAGLALLILLVIGIFVFIRLMLIGPVTMAEGGGSFAILHRSWKLTQGNWWRLFCFFVIFFVGALALFLAVRTAAGIVARLAVGSMSTLSVTGLLLILIAQILTSAIYVVLFVMQTRIYLQLAGHDRTADLFR